MTRVSLSPQFVVPLTFLLVTVYPEIKLAPVDWGTFSGPGNYCPGLRRDDTPANERLPT